MDTSLSVVLIANNAQATLTHQVNQLLDVLGDLTFAFEILIVDDGSTDQTEEVSRDLVMQYPQVRMVRHPWRLGANQSLKSAIDEARGDLIIVQDESIPVSPADLRSLWELRDQNEIVVARPQPRSSPTPATPTLQPSIIHRLVGWGRALAKSSHPGPAPASSSRIAGSSGIGTGDGTGVGIQMIRRSAFEHGTRSIHLPATSVSVVNRSDQPSMPGDKAPKFLSRVKSFAKDE